MWSWWHHRSVTFSTHWTNSQPSVKPLGRGSAPLNRKLSDCPLQIRDGSLHQVMELKYLRVLFTNKGTVEREIGWRSGAAGAVLHLLYCIVVIKRELSQKAKLSISSSILVPSLTYGHEESVMTKRMRSQVQAAKMGFLSRVACTFLRDEVRSSVIFNRLGEDWSQSQLTFDKGRVHPTTPCCPHHSNLPAKSSNWILFVSMQNFIRNSAKKAEFSRRLQ